MPCFDQRFSPCKRVRFLALALSDPARHGTHVCVLLYCSIDGSGQESSAQAAESELP